MKKSYVCLQSISAYYLGGSVTHKLPPVCVVNHNSSRNLPRCSQHNSKMRVVSLSLGWTLVGVLFAPFFFFVKIKYSLCCL